MDWLTENKLPVGKWVSSFVDWITDNLGWFFDGIAIGLETMIDGLLWLLQAPHPFVTIAIVAGLAWVLLAGAIMAEIVATTSMKMSAGLTRLGPTAVMVVGYLIAFGLLAVALKRIEIGVAYAIWSGVGIVLITALAWIVHGQKLDLPALIGMGLIIAGVVVLNLFSKTTVG